MVRRERRLGWRLTIVAKGPESGAARAMRLDAFANLGCELREPN